MFWPFAVYPLMLLPRSFSILERCKYTNAKYYTLLWQSYATIIFFPTNTVEYDITSERMIVKIIDARRTITALSFSRYLTSQIPVRGTKFFLNKIYLPKINKIRIVTVVEI